MSHSIERQPQIAIGPGEYLVTRKSTIISTLLGSCIAVCLYDPINKIAGMNHFLLASQGTHKKGKKNQADAARYGDFAMQLLIADMETAGAKRQNLQSKVFGGGDVLRDHRNCSDNFYHIGEDNCRFAVTFLNDAAIPIIASDIGGDHGRKIYLRVDDFAVFVGRISRKSDELLAQTEHDEWKKMVLLSSR